MNEMVIESHSNFGKHVPSPGRLLHEVRASSVAEACQGRRFLAFDCLGLFAVAATAVGLCHWMIGLNFLPLMLAHLAIIGILIVCLIRGLLLARLITAFYVAASMLALLALLYTGVVRHNQTTLFFAVPALLIHASISINLLISSRVREYTGYKRALRRHRLEQKEKQRLNLLIGFQTEKYRKP